MATSAATVTETPPFELEGNVSRIVFFNPENHWTVLRVVDRESQRDVAVVGTLPGIREGERVRVWGQWVADPRYGRQLKAERYEVVLPATAVGIERYLASGLIPGIGPKTARLLVKRFGEKTFDVIDKNPERLRTVKGVGRKKVQQVIRAWGEQRGLRDSMSALLGLGLTPATATRIFKRYGTEAVARVRANPYALAQEVSGIGFRRADAIARQLDIGVDAPARLRAGLVHILKEARAEGHVCLPRPRLLEQAGRLLEVDAGLVEAPLAALEAAGQVVIEEAAADQPTDSVYAPDLYVAERRIAEQVCRLLESDALELPAEHAELLVGQAEAEVGVALETAQRAAVRMALLRRFSVVTGGPGTGKTTIVRAIVGALEALGLRVALAAPTGRAAKRLGESTRRDARTLHRLLEWQPGEVSFARDEHNPLSCDAVIVDEVSMVDVPLFDALLRALPQDARVVLVGDANQLPSVGPGAVLRDLIDSGVVPVAALSAIFRQAQGSLITEAAHAILNGVLPPSGAADELVDFYWIDTQEVEDILRMIRRLVADRIPSRFGLDPRADVQVLTPMHRGPLGSEGLNVMLGELLNPGRGAVRLAPGDKVMQVRNNYEKEVFNGDLGFVDRYADDGRTLFVRFDDGNGARIKRYELADQDQLALAWAISIHKSQGSEYPAVIVPLHGQHFVMLRRNLVYTAVTRGRQLVVLVGPETALKTAIKAANLRPRFGRLRERLQEVMA